MAWLTDAEFRAFHVTDSATTIDAAITEECLAAAIEEIAAACGESVIAEIEAADDAARKTQTFRRAQRKLAYRELLQFMSSRSRDGGIVETERDENGAATNKYISQSEVEKRRDVLKAEAFHALAPYLTTDELVETGMMPRGYSSRVRVTSDW